MAVTLRSLRSRVRKMYKGWEKGTEPELADLNSLAEQYDEKLAEEQEQVMEDAWQDMLDEMIQYRTLKEQLNTSIEEIRALEDINVKRRKLRELNGKHEVFQQISKKSALLEAKCIGLKLNMEELNKEIESASSATVPPAEIDHNRNLNSANDQSQDIHQRANEDHTLRQRSDSAGASSSHTTNSSTFMAINKESLPEFSGNIMEYQEFRLNAHRLIIDNDSIPNPIDKLRRLKQALPQKIKNHIIHLGTEPGDLAEAIEILDGLCGSSGAVVRHLIEKLSKMRPLELYSPLEVLLEYQQWVAQARSVISKNVREESRLMCELKMKISRPVRHAGFRDQIITAESFARYVKGAIATEYDCISVSNSSTNRPTRSRLTAALDSSKCSICQEDHNTLECAKNKTGDELLKIVREKDLCTKCLKQGHFSRDCEYSRANCDICQRKHHTQFHEVAQKIFNSIKQQRTREISSLWLENKVSSSRNPDIVSHPTTIVHLSKHQTVNTRPILSGYCNEIKCEILIDFGSEVTLMNPNLLSTTAVIRESNIKVKSPIGSSTATSGCTSLTIRRPNNEDVMITAQLTNALPRNQIIIGTDSASKLFPGDPHIFVLESKFGPIKFFINNYGKTNRSVCAFTEDDSDIIDTSMSVTRSAEGRYVTRLPFLSDLRPKNNYYAALKALDKLQQRLKNSGLLETYEKQLLEYVNADYAEQVTSTDGFFMPHNGIVKEESTTPLRVVFNASFGCDSLNAYLWKGLTIGLDVAEKLIRFRQGKFAVVGDLSKAFLQIMIEEADRKYLKFLWKDRRGDVVVYQMKVLPFGLVSSPAILSETIKQILSKNGNDFENCVYMDDLLIAEDSKQKLFSMILEAQQSFKSAGFTLHKIKSNVEEINNHFDQAMSDVNVLGMKWNPKADVLSLKRPKQELETTTKRQLLSVIGRFFDPLGIIDPWKLKLRELFRSVIHLQWDQRLPDAVVKAAQNHLKDISLIYDWHAPRSVPTENITLAGFSDASEDGYGYVVYVVQGSRMYYLFGKSKLSPSNATSVQLEQLAFYELVKMMEKISQYYNKVPVVVFSDSDIILSRLKSTPNKFKRQIAGRLMKTQRALNNLDATVKHIPGDKNPADVYSRFTTLEKMNKNRLIEIPTPEEMFDEKRNRKVFYIAAIEVTPITEHSREKFNSCQSKEEFIAWAKEQSPSTENENDLWRLAIQTAQSDYNNVKNNLNLHLIDGLYRMTTRVKNYQPIWIPKSSPLAMIIIKEKHVARAHSGINDVIAALRDQYYIPGLNRLARKVIAACKECQISRKKAIMQPHGSLPSGRTTFLPFESIAVDMFGPYKFANGKPYYGLIFTCLALRMVKITPMTSLSAEATLIELHNLWCTTGIPSEIYSDNGTNFKKVEKMIKDNESKLGTMCNNSEVFQKLKTIRWHFSPPGAPWFNGAVERMVALVKRCMNTYNKAFRSITEVRIAFCMSEAIINSRPIIREDGRFISPFEMLMTRPVSYLPYPAANVESASPKRLWNQIRATRERFEKLWRSQYLWSLARKQNVKATDIQVGQEVLIPQEMKKRNDWPTAKITKIYPGADGVVRAVTIEQNGKELTRPTNGLILISPGGELSCV